MMDWIDALIRNSGPTWWGAVIGVLIVFGAFYGLYRGGTFDAKGEPDYETGIGFIFVMPLAIVVALSVALFSPYALAWIAFAAVFLVALSLIAWAAKRLAKLK